MTKARWIDVNGVSLRYELSGAGPETFVLVHEIGGTLESWSAVVPALTPHAQVLRYDCRGSGLSEKPRGPITIQDLIDDLASLLLALDISGPVRLAGTAAGAAVCVHLANTYQSSVASLTLFSPALEVSADRVEYLTRRAESARTDGMRSIAGATLKRSFPENLRDSRFADYQGRLLSQDPWCYAAMNEALVEVDATGALLQLDCPVRIIAGRHDVLRPPETLTKFASPMTILEGAHLLPVQCPDAVARILVDSIGTK